MILRKRPNLLPKAWISPMNKFFRNYGAAICRDQFAAKLLRALEPFCFDGTELHRVIDSELRGPENEIAASNLRHASTSQYGGCIPADAIVEVVGKLLDEGKLP
jgi:hypothetical protein